MAHNSTQQEVLLVTGSGFANRQYCEKDSENAKNLSQPEKLKEACWNGLLKDILPELFYMTHPDVKLFLWQMRECQHVLALEMAEEPCEIDYYASIDPYCFMETQGYS